MKNLFSLLKQLNKRIGHHNVVVMAAGIAFYGLLALTPTLIALVSVYGIVADPADIQDQVEEIGGSLDDSTKDVIVKQLEDIVGAEASDGSTDEIAADDEQAAEEDAAAAEEEAAEPEGLAAEATAQLSRWAALGFSILLALWSASGALQKLMKAIALAYEAEENRAGWKVRLMSYGFTAAAIVGIALMILVIGVIPNVLDELNLGQAAETAIAIGQFPALALLFAFAMTVLYRYSPDRTPKTPWRNRGAWVATGLFVLFSVAFSIYSSNVSAMPASYGLLGTIAALMIFLQLMAVAVIVGAEYNAVAEGVELLEPATVSAAQDAQAAGSSNVSGSNGGKTSGRNSGKNSGRTSGKNDDSGSGEILSFGKAAAGLAALFLLGRGQK